MGWPPSPAHILNQKFRFMRIPHNSVKSKYALAGWRFSGDPAAPAIALFHAIRENRKSMVARSEFLVTPTDGGDS